jgi:hypothetical protein
MTATSAPNPSVESTQERVSSALERIADAADYYEFEQAWVEGLRGLPVSNGDDPRAEILAEAGRRLSLFDELAVAVLPAPSPRPGFQRPKSVSGAGL